LSRRELSLYLFEYRFDFSWIALVTRTLQIRLSALLAALLLLMLAQPAFAQPTPAVLTKVTLLTDSPGETRLQLHFEPRANGFAPVGNDVNRPALGLALTTRASSAVSPQALKGLVRQISFEQVETVLILRFSVTAAASVTATASGDKTIDVTVSTGAPAVTVQSDEPGAVASDVPPPLGYAPGEKYEMVQLKYADVSEIVGLLSQGVSVKSNDNFIPHEPAFGSNSLTGSTYNPGPSVQGGANDDTPLGQSIDSGMAIDRRLNAIWLRGPPEYIEHMKAMIAAIDVPTAKIITGDALPILTAITLSGVNGVSQQVQYVNVGVTLQIAPRVSSDGYVSSHVFCVVSSVTGFSQGYPTISQREAETSATVRDGDSFVIGGLSQEDVINTHSKVPLLGDIPILGQAFRKDSKTESKTELYIVVTPHIVHRSVLRPNEMTSKPVYAPTTTTIINAASPEPQPR
jgi:type II secretory pathway component GspD/PulD (secretin)